MGVVQIKDFLTPEITGRGKGLPSIEASGLGVKYTIGIVREDLQTLTYNILLRRRKKEELWALNGVDFVCSEGDILGIVGRNGAGKTTLCRVVSGILRPDKGEIRVTGDVSAMLSAGIGFNPQLSGRENIFLNGIMLGFSKKEMKDLTPGIIEFSGVGRFIDQPMKRYSTGMTRRLSFSIASMIEPDILIVDEVLSAGDLEFSERAGGKMRELIGRSSTVLVVTHNMDFVKRFCTKALWIEKGKVNGFGSPKEVVGLYRESIQKSDNKTFHFTKTRKSKKSGVVLDVKDIGVHFGQVDGAGKGLIKRSRLYNLLLNKNYFWALKSVSLTIKRGEIVGIIGKNGAGKSTLCKVLNNILKPDVGSVRIDGKVNAFLGFGTGFNPQLTGKDNIFLNGMILGISKKKLSELYPNIVEFSELEKFIDEPLKNYSTGMISRLGFSVSAFIEPDIFIIDEALQAGDISFYEKASLKIQELIKYAEAVVVVTHNLGFVENVCTRTIWLHEGKVKFDGTPKKAVKKYRDFIRELNLKNKKRSVASK